MNTPEKRPRVGVGIIVTQNQKVLLGKRKGSHGAGQWSLPGGHLEFLETIEQCVQRELQEETSLQAHTIHLGPWSNDVIDEDKHYITLFAFVPHFAGTPTLLEPHKCEGWHWFDLHNLPEPLFPPVRSLLKKNPSFLLPQDPERPHVDS